VPADPQESLFTIMCNTCGSTECSIQEKGYYDYFESTVDEEWVSTGWIIMCEKCSTQQ
jgi:hypothetical protein